MAVYNNGFSPFEVKETSIKFHEEVSGTAERIGCVGSLEEAMNSKKITKKCEGVVVKNVEKGDGTGELKLSLHMRYDLYLKSFGMINAKLKDGVFAYGQESTHKPFTLTAKVKDEDGVEMLKAYPNVVVTGGKAVKIENGAEEVAEIELTLYVMPDEHGNGVYEAINDNALDSEVVEDWLTSFTPALVRKAVV